MNIVFEILDFFFLKIMLSSETVLKVKYWTSVRNTSLKSNLTQPENLFLLTSDSLAYQLSAVMSMCDPGHCDIMKTGL